MSARQPRVRFGPYEADLHSGELRCNGVRVPLQQQPFQVLRVLLTRPGELVTRDELRRAIWAEGTYVSFDRGLTSAMRKVREALGERAENPLYIETLTGRGYRFRAPVTAVEAAPTTPRRARWLTQCAAALVAAVMGGALGPNTMAAERLAAATGLSEYACLLKSQGRFEDGLATIKKAHALAPESARFTAEVGLHLHATKRYEEEMVMLLRAVRQDAGSADAWLHLGLGYARRSDFHAAIPALERARRLSPQHAYWLDWALGQERAAGQHSRL